MKKIYMLLLMCMFAIGAMAQGMILKKFPADSVPVIDGLVDKIWDSYDTVQINKFGELHPGTYDETPYLSMGYTDDSLILLVVAPDDSYENTWTSGKDPWLCDRIEVYFNVNNWPDVTHPPASAGNVKGVYQYYCDMPFGADTFANYIQWHGNRFQEGGHVDGSYFTFEFAYPFTSLLDSNGVSLPNATGTKFGFDIYIGDLDEGDPQLKWSHAFGRGAWDATDSMGTIYLGSNPNSIRSQKINNISITPNPARNYFNIKAGLDVTLTNVTGQQFSLQNVNGRVDVSALKPGMYYVTAYQNKLLMGTSKLLIK